MNVYVWNQIQAYVWNENESFYFLFHLIFNFKRKKYFIHNDIHVHWTTIYFLVCFIIFCTYFFLLFYYIIILL